MLKTNQDVRNAIKESGILFWQIADKLNINDGNFSRTLRKEFSEAKKEQIFVIINELKGEK